MVEGKLAGLELASAEVFRHLVDEKPIVIPFRISQQLNKRLKMISYFALILELFVFLETVLCSTGDSIHSIDHPISAVSNRVELLQQTSSNFDFRNLSSGQVLAPVPVLYSLLSPGNHVQTNNSSSSNKTEFVIEEGHKLQASAEDQSSTRSPGDVNNPNNLLYVDKNKEASTNHPNETSTTTDTNSSSVELKSQSVKRKRQRLQFPKADWFTKITSKHSNDNSQFDSKDYQSLWVTYDKSSRRKSTMQGFDQFIAFANKEFDIFKKGVDEKPVVYVEQPLKQNPILTIKRQLRAIRGLQKQLVTRSMRQLQQLDNRLIDSYRLCLKKQQPLYAGMLYRTRDFAIRLSQDVKHENKVLDAMAKQIIVVLQERMTNKTIVKEYRKTVSNSTERLTPAEKQSIIDEVTSDADEPAVKLLDIVQANYLKTKNDNSSSQTHSQQQVIDQKLIISKEVTSNGSQATKSDYSKDKPKPVRYIVSVNEVNLRKELNKIQALIDRVNSSCYELTSVVYEINHLFKLTVEYQGKKGTALVNKISRLDKTNGQIEEPNGGFSRVMLGQQKGNRKMTKSPMRLFFEKHGKFNMMNLENMSTYNSTSIGDIQGANPVELKPIFDPASLEYTEPADVNTDSFS